MNIMIDTLTEIIAAGLLALAAVALIACAIVAIARRGRLRIGTALVGGKDDPPCTPYVAEHSAILAELRSGQAALHASTQRIEAALATQNETINAIDAVQGPQIAALKITLKKLRAELGKDQVLNGDLDEAYEEVRAAELQHRELRRVSA